VRRRISIRPAKGFDFVETHLDRGRPVEDINDLVFDRDDDPRATREGSGQDAALVTFVHGMRHGSSLTASGSHEGCAIGGCNTHRSGHGGLQHCGGTNTG